jgi:lipoyl(octanoyl) transferase
VTELIQFRDLGLMRYSDALAIQERAVVEVAKDQHHGIIYSVEHYPVVTLGKNSSPSHFLFSREFYIDKGVEIFETERGGEVTAHMPGQLVVYPILNFSKLNLSVRTYVNILEDVVILTLSDYGVVGTRDPQYPGVWVGSSKICAMGVRIKSRVSMHGLALNISNDLSLFGTIVPCGIKFRGVTSLKRELGRDIEVPQVRERLIEHFQRQLQAHLI